MIFLLTFIIVDLIHIISILVSIGLIAFFDVNLFYDENLVDLQGFQNLAGLAMSYIFSELINLLICLFIIVITKLIIVNFQLKKRG